MSLTPLLSPRSIAIVGASDTKTRIGGVPVDLLIRAGFDKIYPVNPKNDTVQALPAYKAIEDVPGAVDLVILALSAEGTLDQLKRAHAQGIPAAIVYASGYAETNEPEGAAKQAELVAFARASGMKIAGPNCMGNANFTDGVFTTFGVSFQPGEPAGNTALLTQSGNMCATVFRTARRAGVTFSHVINTGNEASVDFSDYLDHLAGDPATQAAVCYIENCATERSSSPPPQNSARRASCSPSTRSALRKRARRPPLAYGGTGRRQRRLRRCLHQGRRCAVRPSFPGSQTSPIYTRSGRESAVAIAPSSRFRVRPGQSCPTH